MERLNDEKVCEVEKKSNFNAKTENEFNRLAYSNQLFINCEISVNSEDIEFRYDINNCTNANCIKKENLVEKLRFLVNINKLKEITNEYYYELSPDNIFYDYNYLCKIKRRDIASEECYIDEEYFLKSYKSFIGYVLQDKYTFENYYNGGEDLLKHNKNLEKYFIVDTSEHLEKLLLEEYKVELEKFKKEKVVIDKKKHKFKKTMEKIMVIITLTTLSASIYFGTIKVPFQKKMIQAESAYIKQDYEKVIKALGKEKINKLDKETKFILAYSYITSENLSAQQKKNVLATINDKTDENILDFWIEIGRLECDKAIDISKKLGDKELQLYSLIKKEYTIENNITLKGEEKQKKLEDVKGEIEKVSKEINLEKK